MKKLIILMLALLPALAQADASVSSDAGRSIDNSQSTAGKRDKSLSTDKSQGRRSTDTDSRETAKEKSLSKSHSQKTGKSAESSKSSSIDININGLLLREFTARYERDNTGTGTAGDYFFTCKPLTRALIDYPIVSWEGYSNKGEIMSRNDFIQSIQGKPGYISRPSFDNGWPVDPSNRYISRYAQCRITASYWVVEAGDRASSQKVGSEAGVKERVRQVFNEMDADESLFAELRQRARTLWSQANCAPWVQDFKSYKSPQIECGVFGFTDKTFTVENRETLSESSIDGRSYKIAVSAQTSDTVAEDDSVSFDDKVSASERKGDSIEHFKESKKTASLNKSKSLDRNSSSKVDRSSGNSMNAAPKD